MLLLKTIKFIVNHPLNQQEKIKSIIRFIKWQIASRLAPGDIIYPWVNDAKVIASPGETAITANIYCGLYEFPEMSYLLHVLSEEDLYIDVGTNVGPFLILACASIGAHGYAFEPIPSTYKRLLENIKINSIENKVKHFNMAVGSENGEIIMTSDQNTQNHVIADETKTNDSNIRIKVISLDEVLANENPVLIKIDVEGFEAQVIEGARNILQKDSLHSVILELNASGSSRFGDDDTVIYNTMLDFGFKAYTYDPYKRKLIELSNTNTETKNTLFIKNKAIVEKKLLKANAIKINNQEI